MMKGRNIGGVLILAHLLVTAGLVFASRFDPALLTGEWKKSYVLIDASQNRDPRWELTLSFGSDGRFRYSSHHLVEKWLSNGTSVVGQNVTEIDGTWKTGKGHILVTFDRVPIEREITELEENLGYEPTKEQTSLRFELNGNELQIKAPERTLSFQKVGGK
jgi:hypothetical protein